MQCRNAYGGRLPCQPQTSGADKGRPRSAKEWNISAAISQSRRDCKAAVLLDSYSPYSFPQKLQEQLLKLFVTAQLVQIRGKLHVVKGDFLWWSSEPPVYRVSGLPLLLKNILFFCSRGQAAPDNMLDRSLVNLISFNTTYLHKCHLRLGIIVCYEINTGEIQLLGITLQNVRQFRYELCQFDRFANLIFCDTKKFCY